MTMPDGFEARYVERTSSKTRNTHRRRRKQLDALGDVRFRVARAPEELEPALAEAQRLHALRWEGRPDQSEFTSERGRPFHLAAIRRLAPLDTVRIVLCELDGVAIAHHYYFALEGRMIVHCLAFDPAYQEVSVGLTTNLETLRAASAEGLTTVEFLGGDERYKLELADGMAPLYQGLGLARGVRGTGAVVARRAMIDLRDPAPLLAARAADLRAPRRLIATPVRCGSGEACESRARSAARAGVSAALAITYSPATRGFRRSRPLRRPHSPRRRTRAPHQASSIGQ